jgi:hypothetical protein
MGAIGQARRVLYIETATEEAEDTEAMARSMERHPATADVSTSDDLQQAHPVR